ncbi:MAG: hypothetical protein FWE36_07565 [Erysipelotrichales bacterium]|nr:hypothetical protein [Erysipelotrichales bacterium]
MANYINLNKLGIPLKNLDKSYTRKSIITKAEIIDYYIKANHLIQPHIKNKPFSMIHYPNGVGEDFFYQKECPKDAPFWLKTKAIPSSSKGEINWCLVNDLRSIIYMANRSVIEMHTWFSRLPNLKKADMAVIDLDPSGKSGFKEAIKIASAFGIILNKLNVFSVPMTSGGSGIHIRIPIKALPFSEIQDFLLKLCLIVTEAYPDIATTERIIDKRGDKVYLDAIQNAYGKTIIAPYSVRARESIPIATPLLWTELTNENLKPEDFTIKNIFKRLDSIGDLFQDFYKKKQLLPKI